MNWKYLFFLGMFWAQGAVFAQSADVDSLKSKVEIKTSDGNIHRGTVKKEDPSSITILREDGLEIEIPKYVIVYKKNAGEKKEKETESATDRATEHASRYLYSPSAFPIKKGEGYINLMYFSVIQAQYGLTDNFSIGITSTPILMPTLLNAKYSVKIDDKLHVSVGGQIGKLWFVDEETLGIGFANVTYGDKKENISVNAGYGFYTGLDEKLPIFSACYARETSSKVAFIAEFWAMFPQSEGPVYAGGPAMRIKVGKNLFFDVGVLGLSFTSSGQYYNADLGTYEFRRNRETYTPLPFLGLNWGL
jgi:hypothetical protein